VRAEERSVKEIDQIKKIPKKITPLIQKNCILVVDALRRENLL